MNGTVAPPSASASTASADAERIAGCWVANQSWEVIARWRRWSRSCRRPREYLAAGGSGHRSDELELERHFPRRELARAVRAQRTQVAARLGHDLRAGHLAQVRVRAPEDAGLPDSRERVDAALDLLREELQPRHEDHGLLAPVQ